MAADLDQALGVGTWERARGDSVSHMAADLEQALRVGIVRNKVTREKP